MATYNRTCLGDYFRNLLKFFCYFYKFPIYLWRFQGYGHLQRLLYIASSRPICERTPIRVHHMNLIFINFFFKKYFNLLSSIKKKKKMAQSVSSIQATIPDHLKMANCFLLGPIRFGFSFTLTITILTLVYIILENTNPPVID